MGVLALQGDVREHAAMLESLGASVVRVRRSAELAQIDGLVIPGGESSVIDKLSHTFGLREPIIAAIQNGMPVLGTCAGLIMLADRISDGIAGQRSFGGLDVTVQRNAFGAQRESFEVDLAIPELGEPPVHATFIRAPIVTDLGADTQALARLETGQIVAVEQGNIMGLSFHPEMSGESRFHERFLQRVAAWATQHHAQ